jgi:aspartate racemase
MAGVPPHPVIGILGGMGPEATVDLMRRIIAATPAEDDADHLHMIVDNNPKIPSRIAALIDGNGVDPAPELIRMARALEKSGATALAMPCNTAHAYAERIAAAVTIPFFNMVLLTGRRIERMVLPNRRIGILASTAVRHLRLYEETVTHLGIELVWPDRQQAVMDIIKGVKRGDLSRRNREAFIAVAEDLLAHDVDLLLIACTELSLFARDLNQNTPVVDSLDVLSEEIIAWGLQRNTEQRQREL